MCGTGVRSILLLPLVARCPETIDVSIWGMLVFMSVLVTVLGYVGMFCCVATRVPNTTLQQTSSPDITTVSNTLSGLMIVIVCVCVGDVMDVVFSVCIVRRGAVGARLWEV